MNLKSKIVLALLATSSAAFAQTAPAAPEVTYNVGVVSQYRYRGIAQTKGDPALQGGVDYANANGFYAGAWGSTIKWIKENGGFLIHLSRMGQKPSNFQERLNDPIVKRNADHIIKWKTFTDEKETCNYHLSKLFYTKGWSTYGDFK